jgi:hypothetical protein
VLMKTTLLTIILIVNCVLLNSQNLIGYKKDAIQEYMRKNCEDMNCEVVTNNKFNYLKYSDNNDTKTMLFFIGQDSVCISIKMICDSQVKKEKEKEFNSLYTKAGENKWIEKRNDKDYNIEITDEKWSYTIIFEPVK